MLRSLLMITLVIGSVLSSLHLVSGQADVATPAADPCAPVVAVGTPVAIEGGQGESVFSPDSPEQSGQVGNPADYPFERVYLDAVRVQLEARLLMAQIAAVHADRAEVTEYAINLSLSLPAVLDEIERIQQEQFPDASPVPWNVITGLLDEGMMLTGGLAGMGQGSTALETTFALAALCIGERPFDLTYLTVEMPALQGLVGIAQLALERTDDEAVLGVAESLVQPLQGDLSTVTVWLETWYPTGEATPEA